MRIDISYDESSTKQKHRKNVLEKAYNLFLMNGIENVTMLDVANSCGIQRRSLYNYYSKKEEIALDLMKCWYKHLAELMVFDIADDKTGYMVLCEAFKTFYNRLLNNMDMFIYSVHFDHYFQKEYNDSAFEVFVAQYFPYLHDASLFERGLEDGSIHPRYRGKANETLTTMTVSLLSLAQRIAFRPEKLGVEGGHTPQRIEMLIDIMLAGIKNH